MWGTYLLFGLLILILIIKVFNLVFDLLNMCKGYPPSLSSDKNFIRELKKFDYMNNNVRVADLGCGYGTIINALKNNKVSLTGFEINPLLYFFCKVRFLGFKNIKIENKNILNCDLNQFDIVIIYGIKELVEKLEQKIELERPQNLMVISNKFKFDKLKLLDQKNKCYIYTI